VAFGVIGCQADMRNVSAYWPDWVVRQKVSRYCLGDMRKVSDFCSIRVDMWKVYVY
jgi:hypothetical protein